MRDTRLRVTAIAALVAATAAPALGAPRVGLVVTSHPGLDDEQADELAYDVAAAVATRIEGEAIAGASVRERLPNGVEAGCADRPVCGRETAATLKTDEVLFLDLKRGAKREVRVSAHRVARDPERLPADGEATVAGAKAKRERAIADLVAALYPPDSVKPWTEPSSSSSPPASASAAETEPDTVAEDESPVATAPRPRDERPIYRKGWFWAVVGGGAVVLAGAIVGIVLLARPGPSAPAVELPP